MSNTTQNRIASRGLCAVAVLVFNVFASIATAGPVQSVGTMTFCDPDTVVLADWRAGEIHALHLAPAASATPKPFNLKNVSTPIARALGTTPDKLRFEDMAFRPGAELAYIAVSVDQDAAAPRPALVSVDATGTVAVVDLIKARRTSAEIKSRPAADKLFWHDLPEATYTVTDLVFHGGKLYVAGLSGASFTSTLRVYDFPFTGDATNGSDI